MLVCGAWCLMSLKRFSKVRPESSKYGLVKWTKLYNHFLALLWSLNNVVNLRAIQAPWICAFTLNFRCWYFWGFRVLLIGVLWIIIILTDITIAGSNVLNFKIKSLINSCLFAWRAQLFILNHEVVLPTNGLCMQSLWHFEAYRAIERWCLGLVLRYFFCKFSN